MKTKTVLLILGAIVLLFSFKPNISLNESKVEKGMIKVAILYPNEEDKKFDMEYYSENHMPMVAELFGKPLRHYGIDKGISGRTPDEPASYIAGGYFYFDQLSDYETAFGTNAEKILGDIPNYTDIQPVVQISEIVR